VRRISESGGTTVSVNTLHAPEKARKSFNKADKELRSENPDFSKAVKELKKAVEEYEEFSAAWDLIARVHLIQGNREEGKKCFQRALELEPKFIPPYLGLAQIAYQQRDWQETTLWTDKILEMDDRFPQALYWNGLAAFYLHDFKKVERSLVSLYDLGFAEQYPFGLLPLGVAHATLGDISAAEQEISRYLELMPPEQVPNEQRTQLEKQLSEWKAAELGPGIQ
jgi:tetratricopeptide (TPR) repeat protein